MGHSRYVEALLWIDQQAPYDPAEFIVRLARPVRWAGARFSASDVDRAARAIWSDPGYRREVAHDAHVSALEAGCGVRAVLTAVERLASREGDGA